MANKLLCEKLNGTLNNLLSIQELRGRAVRSWQGNYYINNNNMILKKGLENGRVIDLLFEFNFKL